ncbi:MAG: cysteine dioxygenase family protein [Chromatiales bacterium]|nr:cysteine dioxygenase family protein [Chromatiales bacterium]
MHRTLADFVKDCRGISDTDCAAADCVQALVPVMFDLVARADDFLSESHRQSDPSGYCRNLIYETDDGSLSLYSLVWLPGQWTPVHDHGSWGVVGVVEGNLEERSYVRTDDHHGRDEGIALSRGGIVLLPPGAVTTFVPNPDHIHLTGVADDRPPVLSLHLYGRQMNSFHVYDVEAGTRHLIDVAHNES